MLNEAVLITLYFLIFLFSVIIHEVAHGVAALWLGDPTAKYAGRLNLNPAKHVDFWGSIVVPFFMLIAANFAFGWAKPVPYNPYNLKNQKWGPALVALAGPLSNIILVLVFAIAANMIDLSKAMKIDIIANFNNWSVASSLISGSLGAIFFELFVAIIFWNVLLAFFNLIPIPPLDGSKVLFSIISVKTETAAILEQFGFFFLIFFIVFFSSPISTFINFMLEIFLGITI
jgi:Zn-dependent protease